MVLPLNICPVKNPQTGFTTKTPSSPLTCPPAWFLQTHRIRLMPHYRCMTDSWTSLGRLLQQHVAVLSDAWQGLHDHGFRLITCRFCAVTVDITINSLQATTPKKCLILDSSVLTFLAVNKSVCMWKFMGLIFLYLYFVYCLEVQRLVTPSINSQWIITKQLPY